MFTATVLPTDGDVQSPAGSAFTPAIYQLQSSITPSLSTLASSAAVAAGLGRKVPAR